MRVLGKFTHKARKLYSTNLMPAGEYGVCFSGVAAGSLRRSRTAAATRAACISGSSWCPTTAIAVAFGHGHDPEITVHVHVIREWLGLWRNVPSVRERFRRAWYKAIPRLLSPKFRWRNAFGPISATIAILLDLGWSLSAPDRRKAGDLW